MAAAISVPQGAFTKACDAPYDVCDWTLINAEFSRFSFFSLSFFAL